MVSLRTGEYKAPRAILNIGVDGAGGVIVSILFGDSGETCSWVFDRSGALSRLDFAKESVRMAEPVDPGTMEEPAVLVCEHIDPGYTGRVFRRKVFGTEQIVCPLCIETRREVASGAIRIMASEIWNRLSEHVAVEDL